LLAFAISPQMALKASATAAGRSRSIAGPGAGGGAGTGRALLSPEARHKLCTDIERLSGDMIAAIMEGRDPTHELGLQPLVSKGFAGARDLAGLLKVLRTVYECALAGKTVTQRELYYMSAAYFRGQEEAKAALGRVSSLLNLERHQLGVLAAARGRVAGLLSTRTADGGVVDLSLTGTAAAISGDCVSAPPVVSNRGAEYILVVEKDAIFARLVEDRVWEAVPCVLVTGCGMPDMATRAFVHHLHAKLRLPVLVLCDANPYGLGILLCYANGSKADGRRFAVPVGWLGLCRADIEFYDLPLEAAQALSLADERKAASLLADPYVAAGETPLAAAIAEEARGFLESREKMELEGLLGRGLDFLARVYLPDKVLERRDWVPVDGEAVASGEAGEDEVGEGGEAGADGYAGAGAADDADGEEGDEEGIGRGLAGSSHKPHERHRNRERHHAKSGKSRGRAAIVHAPAGEGHGEEAFGDDDDAGWDPAHASDRCDEAALAGHAYSRGEGRGAAATDAWAEEAAGGSAENGWR
jgi:meiotic recombination protein SPO11